MAKCVCVLQKYLFSFFVLTQIHEAIFQDDPARSALKSSGELLGGMYRVGHSSELL